MGIFTDKRKAKKGPHRVLHVTAIAHTLGVIRNHIQMQKSRGLEVHCAAADSPDLLDFGAEAGVCVHPLRISRSITISGDLQALTDLLRTIKKIRPTIVHAHTPKAGALAILAASILAVPIRIYHLHGSVVFTATGINRQIYKKVEQLTCALSLEVLSVGTSLREFAIQENFVSAQKIKVLGNGTIGGVDVRNRFNPENEDNRVGGQAIRDQLGIPRDACVIGFVGRITKEKGVFDLVEAWQRLKNRCDAHLMIVGGNDGRLPVPQAFWETLDSDPRIHPVGHIRDPAHYYSAMDMVVLPTYREGFPVVPMEAAAMGNPLIVSDLPPCQEAVKKEVTGQIVPVGDISALADAILRYVQNPQLRADHGKAGRTRMENDFSQEQVCNDLWQEYEALLAQL